jgi:hypothetical protein
MLVCSRNEKTAAADDIRCANYDSATSCRGGAGAISEVFRVAAGGRLAASLRGETRTFGRIDFAPKSSLWDVDQNF